MLSMGAAIPLPLVMMTLSQAVVAVVNREREKQGLDRKAYAARTGLANTTVWNKLTGVSSVKIDDVPALAAGLGWTLSKLMREAQRLMDEAAGL